ncbi:hypothetical protein FE257_006601 [Aspergillus nanangensis]|uniref:Zn(2)-C6 fungal-type domain-containing protein n=1 Tax=Aspergillus nanangensis TaxID=2582783 RepID=A0AAD4CYB4_ASPNN|nr:hypothetical protein FE257_006601 [Aspergillus nanangensis]
MDPNDSHHPSKRRCVRERLRVTRACDTCKKKKLRCSGTLPCSLCQRSALNCGYTAAYTRGKLPSIPALPRPRRVGGNAAEVELQNRQPRVGPGSGTNGGSSSPVEEMTLPHGDGDGGVGRGGERGGLDTTTNSPARESPEPHQTDMEGHYVGPSSGVSFLIRLQKRLTDNIDFSLNTPIFSFGDAPLPKYDPSFLVLPNREDARVLVKRYFDFAFPTHRFLHQQTVERWLEDFYAGLHKRQDPGPGEREVRALLLMIFAQASQYLPESNKYLRDSIDSAVYFGASEHHLTTETGPVRLTSIQARLAQCFYLLSESRINHCWSLFGTTARLAIAIGIHRRRRREHAGLVNAIEHECCKRVFWCAYSLDNYLSAALGRPRAFHDDEIDQDLPEVVEDHQITATTILPAMSGGQSVMLAPVYHAKLSRIISGILHDLYGIRKSSLDSQAAAAAKHAADMTQWRHELASFLDTPNINLLMPTYQRQCTVLNLAFYHAQILLYRPFVLKSFTFLTGGVSRRNDDLHETIESNVQSCLEAAVKITSIVHELCENGKMYRAFWFTHYYAFSAIVVLYVHFIRTSSLQGSIEPNHFAYLKAGEQGQKDLATCGSQSSFAQRYVMVLEELRKEAHKATKRSQRGVSETAVVHPQPRLDPIETSTASSSSQQGLVHCLNAGNYPVHEPSHLSSGGGAMQSLEQPFGVQPEQQGYMTGFVQDTSPASYIVDLTSWGEFDSLATTGIGDFGNWFPFQELQGLQGLEN